MVIFFLKALGLRPDQVPALVPPLCCSLPPITCRNPHKAQASPTCLGPVGAAAPWLCQGLLLHVFTLIPKVLNSPWRLISNLLRCHQFQATNGFNLAPGLLVFYFFLPLFFSPASFPPACFGGAGSCSIYSQKHLEITSKGAAEDAPSRAPGLDSPMVPCRWPCLQRNNLKQFMQNCKAEGIPGVFLNAQFEAMSKGQLFPRWGDHGAWTLGQMVLYELCLYLAAFSSALAKHKITSAGKI